MKRAAAALVFAVASIAAAQSPKPVTQPKLLSRTSTVKAKASGLRSRTVRTSGALHATVRNGAVYKKINALQTVKINPSSRTSAMLAHTKHLPVPLPVIGPELRMSALSYVSDRMDAAPDHFEDVQELRPFFDRLSQSVRAGQPIHILQYGDSHTASDDWVESEREAFQGRYGYGGAGFTMAGHPFRGYRRFDISGQSSSGWIAQGLVGHAGDYRHGLSGVSMTAASPGETVSLNSACDQLELYFLRQPGGGSFTVETDGASAVSVDTNGELSTAVYTFQTISGEHRYTVRTTSYQPVRLFGWVAQNRTGVTWETLGINGAQASMLLGWDEMLWAQQIQRRDPALVVIAYGTNEALSPGWTAQDYTANLTRLIQRFRETVPNASLLLVGPPDCGRQHPFPHLQEVIDIQREVASKTGVAFWDWRHHMGGPGATHMWVRAGLSQTDYTHLTGDGYRMLGKTIAQELDLEYRRYLAQPAASNQVGSSE